VSGEQRGGNRNRTSKERLPVHHLDQPDPPGAAATAEGALVVSQDGVKPHGSAGIDNDAYALFR